MLPQINYDPWNSVQIVQDLSDEEFMMIPMRQGYASMNGPSKEFERLVLSQKINHGCNPVLRWMIDCVTVKQDPADNIKPVKPDRRASAKRIDGVVALIMALDRSIRDQTGTPDVHFL